MKGRSVRLVGFLVAAAFLFPGRSVPAEEKRPGTADELIAKNGGVPVVVYWKDDFTLSTLNEEFVMQIRGNVHFDTKFYGSNSANPSPNFDIRRARMDFRGCLYSYLSFRVQAELADSPYIRNAYADIRFRDWLHLQGGQMKPPFSTSWWTMDNNVNFIERGAGTPIYPYFDRGWWLWGEVFNKALTWNLSGFTGAGMDFDYPRGDIDDQKDWVGRLFVAPFLNTDFSLLKGLYLCAEGTLGEGTIPTTRFEQKGYSAAIRDDKFWTWETQKVGTGQIRRRDRWGFELQYINGPLSLSSEYLVAQYEDIEVFAKDGTKVLDENGQIVSWSSWVSFFLTGERKQVSNFGWKQPKPKVNFNPVELKGTGAWELLFRYTYTKTDKNLFNAVEYDDNTYQILAGADKVDEFTAGVSWTWNPMFRWQFNYVHLKGDGILSGDKANLAGTKRVDYEDMYALRMIFKF